LTRLPKKPEILTEIGGKMKKVIIVGGGYGGITAFKHLAGNKDLEITVIDQNPYHFLQTEVYNFIANKYIISDITVDLFSFSVGVGTNTYFVKDKVVDIDFPKNIVHTEHGKYQYDYLILAVGSRTFFPPIEGLRENSSGVKTLTRSLNFKHQFEQKLLKNIKDEGLCPLDHSGNFNIVVGGGGLSGVEIAAEMAYYARQFFRKAGYICEGVKVTLVEASPRILNGIDDFLVETAMNRLKDLGVEIIKNKKIVKVEQNKVILENTKKINMDFLIWTGGIVGSSLIPKLKLPHNRRDQIIVDDLYRVKDMDNVFAVGDCAEIKDLEEGTPLPPTAQVAVQTGEIVSKHIKNIISGKKPEPKSAKLKGIVAALGGDYGAGVIMDSIKVKGYPAYLLKEMIFLNYKYPLKKTAVKGFKEILKGNDKKIFVENFGN